jgi:hypothetical protein
MQVTFPENDLVTRIAVVSPPCLRFLVTLVTEFLARVRVHYFSREGGSPPMTPSPIVPPQPAAGSREWHAGRERDARAAPDCGN